MNKNMKKIIYVLAFAFLFVGQSVFAAPWNDHPQDCIGLAVSNSTQNIGYHSSNPDCWSLSSVSANAGDRVDILLYYHNTSTTTANNVTLSLNKNTSGASTNHSFYGQLNSSIGNMNLGNVNVNLTSSQTLTYESLRWYPNNQNVITSSVSSPQNVMSGGVNIGTVASTSPSYQGHIVVSFRVGSTILPPPTNNCDVNISASQTNINLGDSTTISWTSSDCNNISITNIGSNLGTSGNRPVSPSVNTNYVITGTGINNTDTDSVFVNVNNNNNQNFNPTVRTLNPSGVSENSATLRGDVDGNGSIFNAWIEFPCYSSTRYGQVYNKSNTNISTPVYGLTPDTRYEYCAVAQSQNQNSSQIIRGNIVNFRTDDNHINTNQAPSVTTYSATNISQNNATLNGYVNGNNNYTTRWFKYGTSPSSLNLSTQTVNHGSGAGNISQSIYGLIPNTTYYFQAVAQNSYGTIYGNVLNFNTNASVIINTVTTSVVTTPAIGVTQNSAQVNGLLLNTSNLSTNVYFEYGTTTNLGNITTSKSIGSGNSIQFSDSLTGLLPNTFYYYRAVGQNGNGIFKGNIDVFQTLGIPTVVNTRPRVIIQTGTTRIGTESPIMLNIENRYQCVAIGNTVDYTLTYKNIGNTKLTKVLIQIILPKHLSYNTSSNGTFDPSNNTLSIPLNDLNSGDGGVIYLQGTVIALPENNAQVVTTALLIYTNPNGAQENAIAYSLNDQCFGNNLGAAALFGIGFGSLLFWLLLIIIILLILLILKPYLVKRNTYNTYNNRTMMSPIAGIPTKDNRRYNHPNDINNLPN